MRNVLTLILGALLLAACLAPDAPNAMGPDVAESDVAGSDATGANAGATPPIADLLDQPVPTPAGVSRPAPPLPRAGTPRATVDGAGEDEADAPQQAQVQVALGALRDAPNGQGAILGYVIQGDMLQVMGASADGRWLRVCCPIDADGPVWIESASVRIVAASERSARRGSPTPTLDLSVILTVTATPTATQTPAVRIAGTVHGARVNLRGGPGTNYATVGQVVEDTPVQIVGRNETGSWLRVCCPAGEGTESWISAEFVDVEPDRAITEVPVAAAPPTPNAPVGGGGGARSAAALAAAPAAGLPGPGGFGAPGGTNPLTGLPLPGGRAGQRPVIVCINNDYAARPQFGTSQADVMYEYLMEGYGITRFSGIFYGEDVGQIGPVRSARLINYYMGALYNAGLACSGASDQVRYLLKHQAPFPYMDIDLDDASNTRYSVSIGRDYRTRLRTDTGKLQRWLNDWGVQEPASIRGFTFGDVPSGGAPATSISIPYPSGTGSNSAYAYDSGSGRYRRSMGGGAHTDGNNGAQVSVENVIVQYVPHEATDIVEDSLGSTSIRLNLFGSERAIVFRDGQAFEGTWRSESRGDTPRFYDSSGSEIPLKPGKTWISIVPSNYTISYR